MGLKELERKIVLHKLPAIPLGKAESYRQGYLGNPIAGLVARPRQEGDKRVFQLKLRDPAGGDPFESKKLDLTDSPEIFDALFDWVKQSPGTPIEKDRYTLAFKYLEGAKECVIDVFHGANDGHILFEAEFSTVEKKEAWQPPDWMKDAGYTEVTGDPRYTNEWIAEHGWPKEVDA